MWSAVPHDGKDVPGPDMMPLLGYLPAASRRSMPPDQLPLLQGPSLVPLLGYLPAAGRRGSAPPGYQLPLLEGVARANS